MALKELLEAIEKHKFFSCPFSLVLHRKIKGKNIASFFF